MCKSTFLAGTGLRNRLSQARSGRSLSGERTLVGSGGINAAPLSPLADAGPLCRMGVQALSDAYRARTLSPVEVTAACLDRAEVTQQRFDAFTLELVDPALRAVAAEGDAITLADYLDAVATRSAFGAAMDALLDRHDVLLSPAVAVPPFAAGVEVPPGSGLARWTDWASFSYPLNLCMAPACVAPCDGYRAALQFVAARGGDARALAAAAAWTVLDQDSQTPG